MPAVLPGYLQPIITDADWEPQFEFYELAPDNPLDLAGFGASLVLTRQTLEALGEDDSLTLDTVGGSLTWLDDHTLVATPAGSALADLGVGLWSFELRLRDLEDGVIVWLTGLVRVVRGLSQIAAGDAAPGSAQGLLGGGGSVQLVRTSEGVKVVAGARGRKGEGAYELAVAEGYEGTREEYAVAMAALPGAVDQAVTAAEAASAAGQAVTDDWAELGPQIVAVGNAVAAQGDAAAAQGDAAAAKGNAAETKGNAAAAQGDAAAVKGEASITLQIKPVATTTYTVLADDKAKMLRFTHASGCAVTLPKAMAAGFVCNWRQKGAAQVIFAAEAGGTLVTTLTRSRALNSAGSLTVEANADGVTAEWYADGDMA